jgi:choline dehydrogenase
VTANGYDCSLDLALPPDNDWNNIGNVTGDATWNADYIRRLLVRIENNDYIDDESTPGHGFDGWLHVDLPIT